MSIQQSYYEGMVRGATHVELVVRLYERMIEDLRQAALAIDQNAIERRTRHINHAILIVGHLQSPLSFANGDKVTRDLNHFYNVFRQNLLHAQFHPSKRALAQMTTDLLAVRAAWIEVDRAERLSGKRLSEEILSEERPSLTDTMTVTTPCLFHPSADDADPDSIRVCTDWQG